MNSRTTKGAHGSPGFEQPGSETHEDHVRQAENQIAQSVSIGLAFWLSSLKAYQTLVNEWTSSRQAALLKSMKAIHEIKSDDASEKKAEQTADVIVDQWMSFQRDLLSVQMKTAAQVGAIFGKARNPAEFVQNFAEMPAQFAETFQRAAEDAAKT